MKNREFYLSLREHLRKIIKDYEDGKQLQEQDLSALYDSIEIIDEKISQ